MKKFYFLILILFFPISIWGQLVGKGTLLNPFSGTLECIEIGAPQFPDTTWSGTVYINGDLIVDDETLTITSGATIIFTTTGADLIIQGSGQLISDGIPSSKILFTKGSGNSSWGHLVFKSSGVSLLDNCIVEYGDVRSGSNTTSFGGAIYTETSNLTVSFCTLRNNYASHGGGFLAFSSASPTISNCIIQYNTAITAGGGLYIYRYSNSHITNCLITNNSAGSTGGGGIFFGDNCYNVRVINSVIANNSASGAAGKNIDFYNNPGPDKPVLINCIVWGNNNSIRYAGGQTLSSGDFVNCAIQEDTETASNFTNCINLSAINNDPSGPNFIAPNNNDWYISPWSPCVNTGLDNNLNPLVPLLDILGQARIGQTDIGAYEAWGFFWRGNDALNPTVWNNPNNWSTNLVPSGTEDIYILEGLTNYPTSSSTQNYTIGLNKSMTLGPGAKATFGTLTNNGTLKLNSSASGNASLILNTYTKGGGSTEEIQLFLTGGGTKTPLTYSWHYISSPVTSLPVSTFAPTYTNNVAQWVQDRPASSLTQAWVAYDGYIYSTGGMGGETFSSLTPGKGYDYFSTTDRTYTFGGQLNTSDVNAVLAYKSGDDDLWGYNLIGNPFSSGLDWDYIIANSFPMNTTKSLYFTRNSTLCTYINGVGVPGDVNGIIPPMQGFFSKTYSTGNTIVLAAAARTHNNIHATYKGSKSLIPLVRLALADSLLTDETVVRFDDLAKSYLDNDFDAVKMFLDPSLSSIHTSLAGTDYAINGLPFPDPETILEIPVTLNIATEEETKSITASELQGLENYNVTLTDISTGFVANLRTTPTVTFAAAKGTVTGRFILKISTGTTGLETLVTTNNKFNIYPANNNINIQTVADEWEGKSGSVRIMDLTGKTISDLKNTEFHKNSLTQVTSPEATGIYVVEIRAGNMRYVGKVVIR